MLLKFPFHKINLLFISLLYLFNLSCNTTEPINDSLTLSVEDVSCTEAWLSLKINNTNISAQISLFVNDVFKDSYSIANSDTTLYIDSLLPSKTYSCQIKGNSVTSNKLTITTLDTTSNSYTWQTFTFGGAASSYLNDVTIVDENNIWAVGNIFVYDSSGQVDQNIYNAVHWDGSKWELSRVQFYTFCGQQHTGSYPANSVITFNDTITWVASNNSQVAIWNYKKQVTIMCLPISVSKMWKVNENEVFTVGSIGQIGHYINNTWQKIESGTELNINDIWGISYNNGNNVILCPAYDFGSGGEKKLLRIQNSKVDSINWNPNKELYTVWFNTPNKIYAGGEGLFTKVNGNWKQESLPQLFKFRVRGTSLNNVWTVGGYGLCSHFNGVRWTTYNEVSLSSGNYEGLDVKENIVVMVGYEGNSAVITIGRR